MTVALSCTFAHFALKTSRNCAMHPIVHPCFAISVPHDHWRAQGLWSSTRRIFGHSLITACSAVSADNKPEEASVSRIAAPVAARIVELRAARQVSGRLLFGVAGGPGSGKSSVARAAAELVGPDCAVVSMDGFHYTRATLDTFPNAKEAHKRRGAPFTFDATAFVSLLRAVRAGDKVHVPVFDHAVKDPRDGPLLDHRVRVVVVEGNYLLLKEGMWGEVVNVLEEAWFLDVPIDLAMQRVFSRHVNEMRISEEEAKERVERREMTC